MELILKICKKQRGYLLIVAAILIVVVGIIATMMAYLFTGNTKTAFNINQSNAALNVAQSALEIAKRDICSKQISCGSYTNSGTVLNGQYSVTGTVNNPTLNSITLSSAITNTDTTIPVSSVTGLSSPDGVISIGTSTIEKVKYTGIDTTTDPTQPKLTGAVRGAFNTTASSYISGTPVNQNLCTLLATGYVPTSTSPNAKRVLKETMNGTVLYGSGHTDAVLYSYAQTYINGNNDYIVNSAALRSGTSPNFTFQGHTIASHGSPLVINTSNSGTMVNLANCTTNCLVTSSSQGNIQGDIIQNYGGSTFTTSQLFSQFFNASQYPTYASLVASATLIQQSDIQITNDTVPSSVVFSGSDLSSNNDGTVSKPIIITLKLQGSTNMAQKWGGNIYINGKNTQVVFGSDAAGPKVVVVTGSIALNGSNDGINIGTQNTQVALVLGNSYWQNSSQQGVGLNGLFYVKGDIGLDGSSSISPKGMIVSEGNVYFNANNQQINLNPSVISSFAGFGNIFNTYYTTLYTQEVFQ